MNRLFRSTACLLPALLLLCPPLHAAYPDDPPNDPDYGRQHNIWDYIPMQFPLASDPEDAAGMSIERAWRDPSFGSARTGRPDVIVAYLEGGVNWHLGNASLELANKVYLNRAEIEGSNAYQAADFVDNGDRWYNAADFPNTPDANGNGYVDPEDLIAYYSDGVDDDANGYPDDISGWDFYNRQNNPSTLDSAYTHANAQARRVGAETNNGILGAAMCPDCMVLPVKAGAEALDRADDLAEAMLYAAHAGASVVTTENAQLGYSSYIREVAEYLWRHNVLVAETSNDFNSTDHQGGMYWPHSIAGNGIVRDTTTTVTEVTEVTQPLTQTFRVRSGQTSWGAKNILSVATIGGSTSESTGTLGGVLGMVTSCAREFPPAGGALSNAEILQTTIATASDITPDDAPKWPTRVGWDLQTGYGRPNVWAACAAFRDGEIAPVAWFDAPEWFSLFDPTVTTRLPIRGHVEARRSPSYNWVLEYGLGGEPETFTELASGAGQTARDGLLGTLDLTQIPQDFLNAAFAHSQNKELETAEQYTVTLRLRVSDADGRAGEERRAVLVARDPSWFPGFPMRISRDGAINGGFSPGGTSQPALVDLQGQGHLAIVYGDADGAIHALDPLTRTELPGWPVRTDATTVQRRYEGVDPRFEPVAAPVSVGDLDHDGHLWVAATSTTGRTYVWNENGQRRAGWPQTLDTGVTPLPIPREPRDFARPPIRGAFASPVLFDLNGDGRLDIIQTGWDGYIHVWNADGEELPGWPVKPVVPASLTPQGYVRINDEKLNGMPAIADLDGDGSFEIVLRSQQNETLGADIQPGGVVHYLAYHADGTPVDGWPNSLPSTVMYYGSAQEFITEGTNMPVAADVDGDGADEVGVNPIFSPAYLLGGDGMVRATYGAAPAINPAGSPSLDAIMSSLAADTPVGFTTSGAFGRFGTPATLAYAQAASGTASVAASLLYTGSGIQLKNFERAVNAATGATLPGFPAFMQGLDFLGAPLFVDVTGDGAAEIVDGGDSHALPAYTALGQQADGFPKYTSGWVLFSPAAGDLDGDGTTELVATTREGYVMAWQTPGLSASNTEWWRYRHDEWLTGRYGTDTRPPGILRALAADSDTRRLAFTAPGDNWYAGRVDHYRLLDTALAEAGTLPAAVDAGDTEMLALPAGLDRGYVQAVDAAGNLGRLSGFALSGAAPVPPGPGGGVTPPPPPTPTPQDPAGQHYGGALGLWSLLLLLACRRRSVRVQR